MQVSFAIVAYNEEAALPRLLKDLKMQDYPHEKIEVLLIDSMSEDSTWALFESFQKEAEGFRSVKLFKNEKKNIPSGHNVALKNYTGEVIVRIDAHASMPYDFISKNVAAIKRGEYAVGGRRPNIIDDSTPWKETLLATEMSMFGSSIASYRRSHKQMYTDSLFCGMYRREVYEKVGLYNELLPRSEDNDMNYRIRKAGYKLCFCPEIEYYQHTRNTLPKLLKQKFLNGYWIGKTLGVSPKCFSLFHFVPFVFVLGIILTTLLCLLGYPLLAILMWSAYGLLTLAMTVLDLIKKPLFPKLLMPLLFFLLHFLYGIGTVVGLIELPFWLKKVKEKE